MPDPAVCPLGIPADPGHDPVGPFGGPYRCECGWVEPMEPVRLLLTGTVRRPDLDEVLEGLPAGVTVADAATLDSVIADAGVTAHRIRRLHQSEWCGDGQRCCLCWRHGELTWPCLTVKATEPSRWAADGGDRIGGVGCDR